MRSFDSPADEYGSAPHRDFGAITLLATDGVGGVSVRAPDGEWLDVPPMTGAFVMNVDTVIAPLQGTGTPAFAPLVFGDFLRHELEASYDNHKPADEVCGQ
jgi:2OG-Fe(II) oxygenase superfamily